MHIVSPCWSKDCEPGRITLWLLICPQFSDTGQGCRLLSMVVSNVWISMKDEEQFYIMISINK